VIKCQVIVSTVGMTVTNCKELSNKLYYNEYFILIDVE
jgi:hypothetical protein